MASYLPDVACEAVTETGGTGEWDHSTRTLAFFNTELKSPGARSPRGFYFIADLERQRAHRCAQSPDLLRGPG